MRRHPALLAAGDEQDLWAIVGETSHSDGRRRLHQSFKSGDLLAVRQGDHRGANPPGGHATPPSAPYRTHRRRVDYFPRGNEGAILGASHSSRAVNLAGCCREMCALCPSRLRRYQAPKGKLREIRRNQGGSHTRTQQSRAALLSYVPAALQRVSLSDVLLSDPASCAGEVRLSDNSSDFVLPKPLY